MKVVTGIAIALGFLLSMLAALLVIDRRADLAEWKRLSTLQPVEPKRFTLEMVTDLPEPARRYFAYTIQPGTPLFSVAEITMEGQFGLGTRDNPMYQAMTAKQILAAPEGFVWAMQSRSGMPISGSDSGAWTRFRIGWLLPVARLGGDLNHRRSAYGRYVAEAVFWTPAALLPGPGVTWDPVDENTARVTVRHENLDQAVYVTVDTEGRPVAVRFQRWSNANPDKQYRLQPFGGYMSDFREVDGYRLPFRVEAGNMFGTDEYFPFFIVNVTELKFPTDKP